jgi:hypothetical protein
VTGNDVKHGLFPKAFFVVVALPVGLPLPDDGVELLAHPVPLLSLLPEAPDPDVDDDGELLLGVEEVGIPLLLEDDVWLPLCLLCEAYTLVVAVNPLAVINATIIMKQTARCKVILSWSIYCLVPTASGTSRTGSERASSTGAYCFQLLPG